jgi:hypothetical protein
LNNSAITIAIEIHQSTRNHFLCQRWVNEDGLAAAPANTKNQNTIALRRIVALCADDLERVCRAAIGPTVTRLTQEKSAGVNRLTGQIGAKRNPPLLDSAKAADYAGACHRAARCADPLG